MSGNFRARCTVVRWSCSSLGEIPQRHWNRCFATLRKKAKLSSFFGWHRFYFHRFLQSHNKLVIHEWGFLLLSSGAGGVDVAITFLMVYIHIFKSRFLLSQVTWRYSRTFSAPSGFCWLWMFYYFCLLRDNLLAVCGNATTSSRLRNGKWSNSYHPRR